MKKHTIAATVAGAVLVLGAAGGAVALASSDDEGSPAATPQEQQVVSAAVAATGGGEANAVERDSEKGATWEVEVSKTDGSTVDVRLDENLHVIAIDADHEDANGR
jgi:hypothetical protein